MRVGQYVLEESRGVVCVASRDAKPDFLMQPHSLGSPPLVLEILCLFWRIVL